MQKLGSRLRALLSEIISNLCHKVFTGKKAVVPAKAGTHAEVPKSVCLRDYSIFNVENSVAQYGGNNAGGIIPAFAGMTLHFTKFYSGR